MKKQSHQIIDYENQLGFSTLRELLDQSCLFRIGKELVGKIKWEEDASIIKKNLKLASEFLRILQGPDPFPISNYFDYRTFLDKINPEGTYLEESEVWEILLCVNSFGQVDKFLKSNAEDFPSLADLRIDISSIKAFNQINSKFDPRDLISFSK